MDKFTHSQDKLEPGDLIFLRSEFNSVIIYTKSQFIDEFEEEVDQYSMATYVQPIIDNMNSYIGFNKIIINGKIRYIEDYKCFKYKERKTNG